MSSPLYAMYDVASTVAVMSTTAHAHTQSRKSEWMSQQDVLAELGISRTTLHKWRVEGRGPTFRRLPNGELRIKRSDLNAWFLTLEEVA